MNDDARAGTNPVQGGEVRGVDSAVVHADAVANAARRMLMPMVRMLIANGVGYQESCRFLKPMFIDAAREALVDAGRPVGQAALSLRAGVQRKGIRPDTGISPVNSKAGDDAANGSEAGMGIALAVLREWQSGAQWQDVHGRPACLRLDSNTPSFQALVARVTSDFSRRAVLDELVGLGFARETADGVEMHSPGARHGEAFLRVCADLGDQIGEHLDAGVANLHAVKSGLPAPFLDHSVYARGLSSESLDALSALAGEAWQQACSSVAKAARERYAADRSDGVPVDAHLRFGAYLYRR